jgi:hypothetical protein
MNIETLDTSVLLPVELKESAQLPVPTDVLAHAAQGRLWHLLAWHDPNAGTCGFYRKNVAVVLPRDRIHSAIVHIMKPAKGSGSVSLDVWLEGVRRCVSVFEAAAYNADSVDWLLRHKKRLEEVLGHAIQVRDLGSDY